MLALLAALLVGAGGGTGSGSLNGGNLSGPICVSPSNTAPIRMVYDEQIRWSSGSCNSGTYGYLTYSSSTGRFTGGTSAGGSAGADFGGCSMASGSTGTITCSGIVRGGKWFQSDGETQAVVQSNAPGSNGACEYDTTNSRWRCYESQGAGAAWNFMATYNADGGTPLLPAGASTPALQSDVIASPAGFARVSDRSGLGDLPMYGNGTRLIQLGGARHWGLESRTLTLNPHMESTVLTCLECTGSTATAFDGLTIVDNAAASTSIVETTDFRNMVTTAVSGQFSSVVSRVAETRRNKFPHMVWTGYVAATTSERVWYGLSSVALNGADAPVGHLAAFRFSTNVPDTKWQACTGDGATTTCTDTGVSVSASHRYRLEIDCRDSSAAACLFTVQLTDGNYATVRKTTNLPTASTNMFIRHYCETLTTAARTCGIGPSSLETL